MEVYNSSYTAEQLEFALGAVPSIGENGNWFVGDQDTGVFAGGVDVTGAEVGQIIKVAAIDENGRPTAWEAADNSDGEWITIADITTEEEAQYFDFDQDINGESFEVTALSVNIKALPNSTGTSGSTNFRVHVYNPSTNRYAIASQQSIAYPASGYRYYIVDLELKNMWGVIRSLSSVNSLMQYCSNYSGNYGLINTSDACEPTTKVRVDAVSCNMGVGSQIVIHGRRK